MGLDTGLDLDRLVLLSSGSLGGGPPPPEPVVEILETSSTEHRVEVSGEPGGTAWLVLGQSYSPGWSARVDGGPDLGAPELVDGFANGWRVPLDETGSAEVDLRFDPQGSVRASLIISLLGAALCLVLVWRGRPSPALVPDEPEVADLDAAARYPGMPPSTRALVVGAATAAVAGLLVLPPALAVVLPVAVIVLARRRRWRWALLVASPLLALLAGAYVVLQQARHDILPGTEWPMELDRVHHVALLAVLLLGVDALVERLWQPEPTSDLVGDGDGEHGRPQR
jgi:hypothetical protein